MTIVFLALASHVAAQDIATNDGPTAGTSDPSSDRVATTPNRMFGVLPNYSTVEGNAPAAPMSTSAMFAVTAKGTFDPYVFPFIAFTTTLGSGGTHSYGARYATAFADNGIGNFMTSAVFPSLLGQDPRYYQGKEAGAGRRAWYALSRIAITRSTTGHPEFNYSEFGGNLTAAMISNAYYPASDRTVTGTLVRCGMQVMWDTASNELKEFWPDIRHHLHWGRPAN
jgi:hypothetical protein